jgi:ribonucleoside-diphosphate reductase alpha chain
MKITKIVKKNIENNYFNDSILSVDCAEIAMGGGDSCRLIALNMFGCVINPFTKDSYFDYDKWYEITYEGQRLNDDLVDLELESIDRILKKIDNDNEPDYIKDVEQRTWQLLHETGKNGRRTGLGFTALGDVLAALNLKYDTIESIEFIEKAMKKKCEAEFDSSIDMAIERGKFVGFDQVIEKTSHFNQMLEIELPNIYARMMKFGRRNISISTVAPNGTISLLTRTTSGIEPLFMIEPYRRKKKVIGNDVYDIIDEMGDKWQCFDIYHPKVKMFLDINKDKKIEDSAYISAANIDWKKRIEIQSVIQKYTTHSISSTINLNKDITVETVSDIYFKGWELGLKGLTIYREGSRDGVMTSIENKLEKEEKNVIDIYKDTLAPKRPKTLHCDVVRFVNNKEKWIGFVGLYNNENETRPYEFFTGLLDSFQVPQYVENGEIVKNKIDGISRYDFVYKDKDGYPIIMTGLNRAFDREYWNYGKMISGVLRHRMPIKNVVELIDSLKFTEDNIITWKAGVKRILKRYIKPELTGEKCGNCGSSNYFYESGCDICKDCGFSKKCS